MSKDILHAMMPGVEVYEADLREGIRIMTEYALELLELAPSLPSLLLPQNWMVIKS